MATLDEEIRTITMKRPSSYRRQVMRVIVTDGPDQGRMHDFDERLTLGSRSYAQLVLNDRRVSGLHCELTSRTEIEVRDLGSKNGTWLGGFRVVQAFMPAGGTFQLGETRMRVVGLDTKNEVPLHDDDDFHGIVGASAEMRAVTAMVARLARVDSTILVIGETGTGKEGVSHALHAAGPRAKQPFVVVDCGSLPAGVIESELFGHERGAFTGAISRNQGAFERANGGTIFLDEIGELPLALQPKLLRVIESRTVRRVGGNEDLPIDVRVVTATNRDLALEVAQGRFREDLYYRLAVITLRLPPLRDRKSDIPLLAVAFLREIGVEPSAYLTPEVLAGMRTHDWPGNVRELRNLVERAVAFDHPMAIQPAPATSLAPDAVDLSVPLRLGKQRINDAYERAYLTTLLAAHRGNLTQAARQAGMDRVSIYRMMDRLGMPRTDD